MRAAASSRASGSPSKRIQIAATAAPLALVTEKLGCTFAARCANSATAGDCSNVSTTVLCASGRASGGSANSRSAPILSGPRLVVITHKRAQRDTSSAMSPAASNTCSRLSSSNSMRPLPITVAIASTAERPSASAMPSAVLTVGITSPACVTDASDM